LLLVLAEHIRGHADHAWSDALGALIDVLRTAFAGTRPNRGSP
jgi:hypothetical protein